MTQAFLIFFIDDELDSSNDIQANARVELVKQLNKDDRFTISSFHPVDFMKKSGKALIRENPDLIIIDYKLSGGGNIDSEFYHGTGYSMTSYCKETYPDVPCYLISQLINDETAISEHYDKKLSHGFLTKEEGRDALASDCDAYRKLKYDIQNNTNGDIIFSALNVPEEEKDNLRIIIPSEFWKGLSLKEVQSITDNESVLIKFAKWINNTFLVRKGPLINALELATQLGVSIDYLENGLLGNVKFKSSFNEAKYTGIFHKSTSERWWSQQSYNIAIRILEGEGGAELWRRIPEKLNIPEKDWSICPVCKKKHPETVAIDKESGANYPCHWICCIGGDPSEDVIGFEPLLYLDI